MNKHTNTHACSPPCGARVDKHLYVCTYVGDIPSFEDHLQSLFKVVYVGPLATAVQSLVLLYQVMESRQTVSGRYYQALYTKLLDPRLKHSKKQVCTSQSLDTTCIADVCVCVHACVRMHVSVSADDEYVTICRLFFSTFCSSQ